MGNDPRAHGVVVDVREQGRHIGAFDIDHPKPAGKHRAETPLPTVKPLREACVSGVKYTMGRRRTCEHDPVDVRAHQCAGHGFPVRAPKGATSVPKIAGAL